MEAQPNFQLPPCTSKEQAEHSLKELIADPYATPIRMQQGPR